MRYATPETCGIPSAAIEAYLRLLEENRLATHNVIIARGDAVAFEHYWKPFERDFIHRMYSVTKSFVAIAVGFALQDGLLSLDDPMDRFFHAELEGQTDDNLRFQTVRNMMMMCTAKHSQTGLPSGAMTGCAPISKLPTPIPGSRGRVSSMTPPAPLLSAHWWNG